MKAIECTDLVKKQGRHHAFNGLSFNIEENTITGLIGRNGAGKTTLMKILAGFWRETAGEVRVFSERPFNNIFVSANSILIDEQINFPTALTLTEIFTAAERFYAKWDMKLAMRLFQHFNFQPDQIHQRLSKGKKSTFNMIIGLASRCGLTMFDEPTNGMDAAVRSDFYRALLKDYIAHPRTIMISSHHLDELEDVLEDILLIDEGRQLLHSPIDEFREYAVGLTGRREILTPWVNGKPVLYSKEIDRNTSFVVIRNRDLSLETAERIGLSVSPVSANDVCIYLTNKQKGAIDDVFK